MNFYLFLFYAFYGLPGCISEHHVYHTVPVEDQEKQLDPLGLESQMVGSCHMVAGNKPGPLQELRVLLTAEVAL